MFHYIIQPLLSSEFESVMTSKKTSAKAARPKLNQKKTAKKHAQSAQMQAKEIQASENNVKNVAHSHNVLTTHQRLVNDALWLFACLLLIYITIALFSFQMTDPAWSRGIKTSANIHNWGGILGAYFADIAYYLFGISVWWVWLAMLMLLCRRFRPIAEKGIPTYDFWVGLMGFSILLICSPIFEFLALETWLKDSLPLGAGGLVGMLLSPSLAQLLGVKFSLFITFMLVCLSLSLLIQVSWLDLLENIGNRLERLFRRLLMREKVKHENTKSTQTLREKLAKVAQKFETTHTSPSAVKQPKGSTSNRKLTVNVSAPIVKSNRKKETAQSTHHGAYALPDLGCLKNPTAEPIQVDDEKLRTIANLIETKLLEFGIEVQVVAATAGPVITRFEIEPAKGVKGSQIVNLSKDLARALATQSVRVVETIPGKNTMGIELPNEYRQEVLLQEILTADVFVEAKSKLTVALGKDIAGFPVVGDLAKMPHLLVGGMTGSGKSVGVNAMIMSILYKATPDEVRFIMIDPKMLELSVYEGIAHLLCPVVTDMKEAGNALNWCVAEMEKRYRLLSHLGVRNLAGFNEKIQAAKDEDKTIPNPFSLNPDQPEPLEKLPQIVVVIDELADLMMTEKKAVETQIARLAQKARAAGIHMIIATQRPSVDVITGLIKANVPTRMAFTVQSRIDSRTILDQMGAEDLLKYGDLLFLQPGEAEPTRLQGAFVSDEEVHKVVDFVKTQAQAHYVEGILTGEATSQTNGMIFPETAADKDELFDQAVQFIISSRKTSISALQRHLRIGYNRAANLMQSLEEAGIVSAAEIDGKRQILIN